MNAHFDIEAGDEEILKNGVVDFYSFSYYSSLVEGQNVEKVLMVIFWMVV